MDFKKLLADKQAAAAELAESNQLTVEEVNQKASRLSMSVISMNKFYKTFNRFPTENEANFAWQFSVEQLITVLNDPKRNIQTHGQKVGLPKAPIPRPKERLN